MKILIQDPATKFYLDAEKLWTSKIDQAREFASPSDALLVCDQCRLTKFQIVVKFKSPDFDMTLTRTEALMLNAQLEVEDSNQVATQAAQSTRAH